MQEHKGQGYGGSERRAGIEAQMLSSLAEIRGEIRMIAGKQEDHDYQSQQYRKCLNDKVERLISDSGNIKTRLEAVERWTGTGSKILKGIFAICTGSGIVAGGTWLKEKLKIGF